MYSVAAWMMFNWISNDWKMSVINNNIYNLRFIVGGLFM
jgi:hypothetical protein